MNRASSPRRDSWQQPGVGGARDEAACPRPPMPGPGIRYVPGQGNTRGMLDGCLTESVGDMLGARSAANIAVKRYHHEDQCFGWHHGPVSAGVRGPDDTIDAQAGRAGDGPHGHALLRGALPEDARCLHSLAIALLGGGPSLERRGACGIRRTPAGLLPLRYAPAAPHCPSEVAGLGGNTHCHQEFIPATDTYLRQLQTNAAMRESVTRNLLENLDARRPCARMQANSRGSRTPRSGRPYGPGYLACGAFTGRAMKSLRSGCFCACCH